jgi:hypothetical protein
MNKLRNDSCAGIMIWIIAWICVPIIAQGQSAYFMFDSIQENNFQDDSALGLKGELSNFQAVDPLVIPGVSGNESDKAVSFDGDSASLIIDDSEVGALIMSTPITLELWARSSDPNQSSSLPRWISYSLSAQADQGNGGYGLGVMDGNLAFVLYGLAVISADQVPFPYDGQWHHAAVTYDGRAAMFYLDGAFKQEVPYEGMINAPDRWELDIASEKPGKNQCNWKGDLDRIRFSDRILDAAELDSNPQEMKEVTDSTVLFLNFDEGKSPYVVKGYGSNYNLNAVTIRDRLASGFTYSVIVQPPKIVEDSPRGIAGDYSIEMLQDRSNYVLVKDPDGLLALTTDWTVEMWIKPQEGGENRQHLLTYGGPGGGYSLSTYNNDDPQNVPSFLTVVITDVVDVPTVSPVATPMDGKWHHLAVSFEGGSLLRFYLDGILSEEIDYVWDAPLKPVNQNLWLGSWDSGTCPFKGLFDRVRISSKALPPEELDSDPANPIQSTPIQAWELY